MLFELQMQHWRSAAIALKAAIVHDP